MTHPRECSCGSGEWPEAARDARGIFISYVCSRCRRERLQGYRPEIFTDPQYPADEQIEPGE